MSKEFLSEEPGFKNLSLGAQEIARYHDAHDRSISGIFKDKPELLDSLDEYNHWVTVVLVDIEGEDVLKEHSHPLKKVLNKNKK